MPQPIPDVAELINALFRTHLHPDGREYLAVDLTIRTEGVIQPSHLHGLRSGKIKNPKRTTLLALCDFFNVSPTYFFPELAGRPLTPR